MAITDHDKRTVGIPAAYAILAAAGLVAGCAKSHDATETGTAAKPGIQVLTPDDFLAEGARPNAPAPQFAAVTMGPPAPTPGAAPTTPPVQEVVQIGAPADVGAAPASVSTSPSASASSSVSTPASPTGLPPTSVSMEAPKPKESALPADKSLVIDAVVGQINGKPLFASEIFEPLDGRLRALSDETRTRAEFIAKARQIIGQEVERRVRNELILSESRANLTPEVRAGLFHFIDEIRNSIISQQRGSEIAADEATRQNQGRGLNDKAKDELDQELIINEINQRVWPRVQVSWHDVQQRYEKDYDKYNPPAIAHLRLILIPGPEAKNADAVGLYEQKVRTVTEALASGKSFADVASQAPNDFGRSTGGKKETTLKGEYAKTQFLAAEEANRAAQGLQPGQWAGPITYVDQTDRRERTVWVFLESIEHPKATSLADAQLPIQNELREERFNRELGKYIDSLERRGNVSDKNQMAKALLDIAVERYVPPSRK